MVAIGKSQKQRCAWCVGVCGDKTVGDAFYRARAKRSQSDWTLLMIGGSIKRKASMTLQGREWTLASDFERRAGDDGKALGWNVAAVGVVGGLKAVVVV